MQGSTGSTGQYLTDSAGQVIKVMDSIGEHGTRQDRTVMNRQDSAGQFKTTWQDS